MKYLQEIKIAPINLILIIILLLIGFFSLFSDVHAESYYIQNNSSGTQSFTGSFTYFGPYIYTGATTTGSDLLKYQNFQISCSSNNGDKTLFFYLLRSNHSTPIRYWADSFNLDSGSHNLTGTFNISSNNLSTDETYYIGFETIGSLTDCSIITDLSNNPKGELAVNDFTPPIVDTSTRIIQINPLQDQTVASSTPFTIGFSVYIGDEVKLPVRVNYNINDLNNAKSYLGTGLVAGFMGNSYLYSTSTIINSYGQTDFYASTTISNFGNYRSFVSISSSCYDIPFLGYKCFDVLDGISTSTTWVVATSTAFGASQADIYNQVDQIFNTTASSTISFLDFCSPFEGQFNMFKCVAGLFIPDQAQFSLLIDSAKNNILNRAPWGYATRLYDIFMASTTPEVLPSTAISIPVGLPEAGRVIDFNVFTQTPIAWQKIASTSVDTIEGSPAEKFLFYWNLMWYIVFGFYILRRIYGVFDVELGFLGGDATGRIRRDVKGRYYQEYSNADIKRKIKRGTPPNEIL